MLSDRITPAGAGKTLRTCVNHFGRWDHPRRCGENGVSLYASVSILGSPPQVRGKPYPMKVNFVGVRITPAGAGKTYWNCAYFHLFQDHPRRCGENPYLQTDMMSVKGSPPQVRGKPTREYFIQLQHRITPAGAGKTRRKTMLAPSPKDHPRRCGENSENGNSVNRFTGSPPQVRGKLKKGVLSLGETRITPAGAGKTHNRKNSINQTQDHPRRCGENPLTTPIV